MDAVSVAVRRRIPIACIPDTVSIDVALIWIWSSGTVITRVSESVTICIRQPRDTRSTTVLEQLHLVNSLYIISPKRVEAAGALHHQNTHTRSFAGWYQHRASPLL